MATNNTTKSKLDGTTVPAFPFAPVEYQQQHQDQFMRVLTLYLQQNDNFNNSLITVDGARFLSTPYGSFLSTSTQTTAAANTATAVTLSSIDGVPSNSVYVGSNSANVFPSSKIYCAYTGVYNMQFSLQLENSDTTLHDVNIWIRYNGANVDNSNTVLSVPNKHGGVNGHTVAAWNFFVSYADPTDYYELYWSSDSTQVSIPIYATTAPAPATPSVILTMQFVSRI